MSNRPVYEYDAAILRQVPKSVCNGLSAEPVGPPDYRHVCAEHDQYEQALRTAGVETHVLPALEGFPDSLFVEDPALVFGDTAIVLRPGTPSRLGEAQAIKPSLAEYFASVIDLPGDGFADGGDVLVTPREVMIGLSARTDRVGAESIVSCVNDLGLSGRIVETPPDVLHFKSDCSLLDGGTVLSTVRLAESGVFDGYTQLIVPDTEQAAANALRVNDTVLLGAPFPQTAKMLRAAGYRVVEVPTQEIAKIDAGLSCMSLRWRRT